MSVELSNTMPPIYNQLEYDFLNNKLNDYKHKYENIIAHYDILKRDYDDLEKEYNDLYDVMEALKEAIQDNRKPIDPEKEINKFMENLKEMDKDGLFVDDKPITITKKQYDKAKHDLGLDSNEDSD